MEDITKYRVYDIGSVWQKEEQPTWRFIRNMPNKRAAVSYAMSAGRFVLSAGEPSRDGQVYVA